MLNARFPQQYCKFKVSAEWIHYPDENGVHSAMAEVASAYDTHTFTLNLHSAVVVGPSACAWAHLIRAADTSSERRSIVCPNYRRLVVLIQDFREPNRRPSETKMYVVRLCSTSATSLKKPHISAPQIRAVFPSEFISSVACVWAAFDNLWWFES